MAQGECQRYIKRCFVCGVTEHHALVACTLVVGSLALDPAVDVGTLFVDGRQHTAGISVETEFASIVAYFVDYPTRDVLDVDICTAFYLAGHYYLTGCYKCFASYFRLRVASEEFIKDGIGNLVGDLVGMPFGY